MNIYLKVLYFWYNRRKKSERSQYALGYLDCMLGIKSAHLGAYYSKGYVAAIGERDHRRSLESKLAQAYGRAEEVKVAVARL